MYFPLSILQGRGVLENFVADCVGFTFLFSIKSDVANNKSLYRNIKGSCLQSFKWPAGKSLESRWVNTPLLQLISMNIDYISFHVI